MIKHLKLENFRNHKRYSLSLEKTTVLIGKNGVGKTNILESITLISYGKSFREDDRKNLIMTGEDWSRVSLDDYEIFLQKRPRLLTKIKNRGVPKRLSETVGQLPSVVFSPETMNIINGEPKQRRRFLDIAISQVDRRYLKNLSAYTKVRRQRNKLLERVNGGLAGEDELNYWDEQLAGYGEQIIRKRIESVASLNSNIINYYRIISGSINDDLQIDYYTKTGESLLSKLISHRHSDIASKNTNFGPHRDDLIFRLNNMDMSHYASRGETRSAVLALKVAELNYLEEERKKSPEIYSQEVFPLLLLDDVYSEFDANRRTHLADLISKHQTLITTTDIEHLSEKLTKSAKVIEI
jgi:DNA replication and repair protein RecF